MNELVKCLSEKQTATTEHAKDWGGLKEQIDRELVLIKFTQIKAGLNTVIDRGSDIERFNA